MSAFDFVLLDHLSIRRKMVDHIMMYHLGESQPGRCKVVVSIGNDDDFEIHPDVSMEEGVAILKRLHGVLSEGNEISNLQHRLEQLETALLHQTGSELYNQLEAGFESKKRKLDAHA